MTNKETPSKTKTSVILYYSSSEGIHIEEPQETHKFRPETMGSFGELRISQQEIIQGAKFCQSINDPSCG